ncbi:MAG: hypothetical protein CME61_06115 [Halobacteriovoraceae bacterium]|nr:hypothetical protein [Halobacteriovoraceae bacterium]
MAKIIILLSLLFNTGCLKFSGEESSSNSVPVFDKSPTVSKKRESKTLDFRPQNSITITSSNTDPSKLNRTYLTLLGDGKLVLATGSVSKFGLNKLNTINSKYGLRHIVVKESYGNKSISTRYKNLSNIKYKLRL